MSQHVIKNTCVSQELLRQVQQQLKHKLQDDTALAGWFMGTAGENRDAVVSLITEVIDRTLNYRKSLFPNDPHYITESVKSSKAYQDALYDVEHKSKALLDTLIQYSLPFSSFRYQGHMIWDMTLPSIVGYFAGMLQNQNNVTPQASPATTLFEILACNDIAQMIGFVIRPLQGGFETTSACAWSHITSGGTVANIESVWAARELKYFPLGVQWSLREGEIFENIKDKLYLNNGLLMKQTSAWTLLNLTSEEILKLPAKIASLLQIDWDQADVWKRLTKEYSLNAKGMMFFDKYFLQPEGIHAPAIVVPSSKHYSWVKSTSLLGMGSGKQGLSESELQDIEAIKDEPLINVYVDSEGRVKTDLLKQVLDTCQQYKKPIIMNVAVVGSTEEGAVDPVDQLLAIRQGYRDLGVAFEYNIHVDAAWGGYFLACIRKAFDMGEKKPYLQGEEQFDNEDSWLRQSVYNSLSKIHQCDSVTIDPHKMGYIPYPAGSLTYRNENIINLLSFSAPYINSENAQQYECQPEQQETTLINTRNIGESGIEGSKPGAAATSIFLSHHCIRPDKRGYGHIINQSVLNSKLLYLYLATLDLAFPEDGFEVVMLTPLAEELHKLRSHLLDKLWIINQPKAHLVEHDIVQRFLRNIAGDQNIVDYIFVDKGDPSIERTLTFNHAFFDRLSVMPGDKPKQDQIFISMTTFNREDYGNDFMNTLSKRIYQRINQIDSIPCIRSVVMDPWAIYTHEQQQHGLFNFFTDIFIPKLRQEANILCQKGKRSCAKSA